MDHTSKPAGILMFLMFWIISGQFIAAQTNIGGFADPPREFSVMPFWFWNDSLDEAEIIRQIDDFEAHGVYGFVIHPRIGLPENIGWLSPAMLHYMHVAIGEAAKRKMYVILYDEGMYPSGSSSGQVVAKNPGHAARGLARIELANGETYQPLPDEKIVAINKRPGGERVAIVERFSGGVIRGIHYIGEETGNIKEDLPPAGDILNPEAVSSFIELVYDRFATEFSQYFGTTILGIFTDEPSPMGRSSKRGMVPGNASLLPQINRYLGYDFTPYLYDLWYSDRPDSPQKKADYHRAINHCLEENYYRRLGAWCERHGISLMGHPAESMDLGTQRYFQVPGQDLVWRYVEPGPKALEGAHSTMAKGASGAMIHLGLRRNSNELYGAYGHNLTWEEMEWLANWCFVRGHNFLMPHAFYYSVRGPRLNERPPDVGPNASWWDKYKPYADACRRLSWINTDSKHICEVAILAEEIFLPYKAAKICYQNQRDFNYLEIRHLFEDVRVDKDGIHIAGMNYKALVIDSVSHIPTAAVPVLQKLADQGRLIVYNRPVHAGLIKNATVKTTKEELIREIDRLCKADLVLNPASENIRYRHVFKEGSHYYMLFNEDNTEVHVTLEFSANGKYEWLNADTGEIKPYKAGEPVHFDPYALKIMRITPEL